MTAVEVLNLVLKAGGQVIPNLDRPRLLVPLELKRIVQEHREGLRVLVRQSSILADRYREHWSLQEAEPLEVFQAAYRDIVRLETENSPELAWRILRQAATDYHTETGICPFCRISGELHLPAEQISEELLSHHGPESADVCKSS